MPRQYKPERDFRRVIDERTLCKQNYKIVPVNLRTRRDRMRVLTELEHLQASESDQFLVLNQAEQRLLALLAGQACETLVVEQHVLDQDHSAAYGRFHYLSRYNNPKFCKRVHFFATSITHENLADLEQIHHDAYLGFVTVRPLPASQLGYSVLSTRFANTLNPNDPPFLTCSASFAVNLAGNTLNFEGCPWMQQDRVVSRCATAALWMVSWYMAHKFGPDYRGFLTSEITELAANYLMPGRSRSVSINGLTREQMIQALKLMGYNPINHEPSDAIEAHRIAYRYVESGLPVILGLEFPELNAYHAITLIGHEHNVASSQKASRVRDSLRFISDEVPGFIAQDDSGGPFRTVKFKQQLSRRSVNAGGAKRSKTQRSQSSVATDAECLVLMDPDTENSEIGILRSITVPCPREVAVSGSDAAQGAKEFLDTFVAYRYRPLKQLSARTFLLRSDRLKCWLREESDLPKRMSAELCQMSMTRWVWFTEISWKDGNKNDCAVGCVIQDPASHPTPGTLANLIACQFGPDLITTDPDLVFKYLKIRGYEPHNIFTGAR